MHGLQSLQSKVSRICVIFFVFKDQENNVLVQLSTLDKCQVLLKVPFLLFELQCPQRLRDFFLLYIIFNTLHTYVCIFYLQTATVCNSTSRKYVQFMHFLAALREHVLHGDKGRACVQDYHIRRINNPRSSRFCKNRNIKEPS